MCRAELRRGTTLIVVQWLSTRMALHSRSCITAAAVPPDVRRAHTHAALSRPAVQHSCSSCCCALSASCKPQFIGRWHISGGLRQRQRQWRRQTCVAASGIDVTLACPDGTAIPIAKDVFTVGSASDADLRVTNSAVEQRHAQLERKGGRVFITALAGDPDDLLSDTHTWLNDSELRHGVAYLVAPGSRLSFGSQEQQYTLQFEEVGSASPAMEMLMKGMASGGSDEVRKQLEGL